MRAAIGAVLASAVILAGCATDGAEPADDAVTTTAPAATGALAGGEAASCAEEYGDGSLQQRGFAFDGTVERVGEPGFTDRGDEGDLGYVAVTFTVHEWFAGGGGEQVVVGMDPPTGGRGSGADAHEGGPSYGVGSRLLVSGEPRWGGDPLQDPVAWGCGFTRHHDEATARQWREAFAAPPEGATGTVRGDGEGTDGRAAPYGVALFMAPLTATHLSITDFDAVRARLGVPDLSSEDLMTHRLEFWREAEGSAVLLTGGLLREENSRLDLRYGFTQDDVDWEARWSGEDPGYALQLRPGVSFDDVRRAVTDGVAGLDGAAVLEDHGTVVNGVAEPDATWAEDPALVNLLGSAPGTESVLLRRGCVPVLDALGTDAGVEDLEQVVGGHDLAALVDVEAVAVVFTGDEATIRLAYPVGTPPDVIDSDLRARAALAADWPTTGSIGFPDGYAASSPSVLGADGAVGQVAYEVVNPVAAAGLALGDLVPLGVCAEVPDLAEPTGL